MNEHAEIWRRKAAELARKAAHAAHQWVVVRRMYPGFGTEPLPGLKLEISDLDLLLRRDEKLHQWMRAHIADPYASIVSRMGRGTDVEFFNTLANDLQTLADVVLSPGQVPVWDAPELEPESSREDERWRNDLAKALLSMGENRQAFTDRAIPFLNQLTGSVRAVMQYGDSIDWPPEMRGHLPRDAQVRELRDVFNGQAAWRRFQTMGASAPSVADFVNTRILGPFIELAGSRDGRVAQDTLDHIAAFRATVNLALPELHRLAEPKALTKAIVRGRTKRESQKTRKPRPRSPSGNEVRLWQHVLGESYSPATGPNIAKAVSLDRKWVTNTLSKWTRRGWLRSGPSGYSVKPKGRSRGKTRLDLAGESV